MADNTTTRTQIPAEVDAAYQRTLLERVTALFTFTKWAQVRDIQQNAGTATARFRRYGNLTAATTGLTEGVTPVGSQLAVTTITASATQYGDFVTITDVVDVTSQDPVLTESVQIQADQAADTFDQLTRDILAAGTSVFYAAGMTQRSDVAANAAVADYRKIARALSKNNAKKITGIVNATTGIGTTPVDACYVVIISPDTYFDLKGLAGFIPVRQYPSSQTVMQGEVGSIDEFRFIQTTNAKVFTGAGSGSADVHADIILAQNAYGLTRITGKALESIFKPLGSGGSTDPLNQRQTQGWKGWFVAKRLNESFLYRYEHTVSA